MFLVVIKKVIQNNGLWFITHSSDEDDCATFRVSAYDEPFALRTVFFPFNVTSIQRFRDQTDLTTGFIDDCPDIVKFHNTNGKIFMIDYGNYMGYVVCLTENDKESLFFTLASRESTLSEENFKKMTDFMMENYEVDISTLKAVRQENCEYLH